MPIAGGLADLVGGIYNLVDKDRGVKRYFKDDLGNWRELPEPEFDPRDILMGELLQQGELEPQSYEVTPRSDVSTISEDPALRESELRSLYGMEQIAEEGLPLVDRLMAEEAQRRTGSEFQRANDAIIADLARRGRAGGGTELAARNIASGHAAELARGQGADLAQMAVGNRVMALRDAASMAGDTRGQDREAARINAEMMNRFNEWLSNLDTDARRYQANQRSAAQLYNLGERQRIADANVRNRYESERSAQERQDLNQQRLFDARYRKTSGISDALGGVAGAQAAREAAKQQNVRSVAGGVGGIVDSVLKAKGYNT